MSNVMASSSKNSSEIVSFMRNVPNSDLTYLLQVLQEKTAQHVRNSVSDINNLVHSVINPVHETSDADLIYRYCAIRKLWNTIENAQSEALKALERLNGRYFCGECQNFVVINYKTTLLNNLKSHTCSLPVASGLCKVKLSSISKEYELYQHVQYDESVKEQLFYKVFVKEKKQVIYFYTVYVTDTIITCIACCCEISGKNNILQHISGNRHIKTLNEYYDAILVYHSYFEKVHPEYQLRQREFCPVDIKKAKCSICKREIQLAKLEGHLIGPCFGGLRPVNLENINTDYELYKNVRYDENISRQLFYKGIALGRNETMYFYSVHVSSIVASCRACNCAIHGISNIEEHILGWRHTKMLYENYDALLAYHKNFVQLNPECQLRQTKFTPVSEKKVNCTVCNKQIPFTKLPNHVVGACFGGVAVTQDDIIAQYDNLVKTTIYNGLLQWSIEIDKVNYPILQRMENQIYCMVCNKFLNKHVHVHMEGSEHHLNKSQKITKDTLKKYHKMWTIQPAYIQIQQIYFRRRDNRITCTLCSISLYYETCDLFNHVQSTGHKWFLMEVSRSSKYEMKMPEFDLSRDASVETDRDMRGSTSSLTVVEKKSIEGVNHRKEPIKPRQLSKSASDLNVEVESDSSESFTVETDERSSYSTSSSTSSIIKEPAKDETSDSSLAKILKIPNLYKEILNILGEKLEISKPNEIKNEIMKTPDTISEEPKTLQDISKDQKATVLNEDESDEVVTKTVESKLSDPLTQPEFVNYSEEVINKLYGGELIHYYLRLGNVKYPFIQNIPDSLHRCLICNVDIMGSIIFHINSTPHVQSLDRTEKIDQLKKFHDFWVEAVEEYQHEQMNFDIGEKLTCRFCLEEIDYDLEVVKRHILEEKFPTTLDEVIDPFEVKVESSLASEATNITQSTKEQDCASKVSEDELDMDDFAQTSSIEDLQLNAIVRKHYNKVVMKSIYADLTDFTFMHKNSAYLYIQLRHNSSYCLICQQSLDSTTEHVEGAQHLKRSKNKDVLKEVKRFHDIFLPLTRELQAEQVYFVPNENATDCLLCDVRCTTSVAVKNHLESALHQSRVMEEPSLLQEGTDVKDLDTIDEFEFKVLDPELELQSPTVSHNENLIGNWIDDLRFEQEPNSVKYYIYSLLTESEQNESDPNMPQPSAIDNTSKQSDVENIAQNMVDNERYEQESNSVKYYIDLMSSEPEQKGCYLKIPPPSPENETMNWDELFDLDESSGDITDEEHTLEPVLAAYMAAEFFNNKKMPGSSSVNDPDQNMIRDTKRIDDIRLELEPYSAKYCVYPSLTESEQKGSDPNMPHLSTINDASKQSDLENIAQRLTGNVVEDVRFEQEPNSLDYCTPSTSSAITTNNKYYDELVMDSIYKHLTKFTFSIDNEPYLYIQHRGASLFCLICQESIRDVRSHPRNLRHLNRSRSGMVINTLRLYHGFFLRLPCKLQMDQIYFTCKKNIIKCTLCGIRSAASSVLKPHLMSNRHRERVSNQRYDVPKGIDNGNFLSFEAPSTPTNKSNDTSHVTSPINTSCDIFSIDDYRFSEEPNCVKYYIYSTMTGDYCDDASSTNEPTESKYMISTSNGKHYCFLCERTVSQDHAGTKKHIRRTGRTVYGNARRRIDIFLEQWNEIDKKYHHMREEFVPASPTITLCLSCGVNLEYSVLESHLKEHHDDASDSHVYAKLYAAFRGPPTFYSDGINGAYFFDNVPQCNIIVDTVSYPIFQTTIQGICCLLCRLALVHSIEHHLSTTSHLNRLKNRLYRQRVVKYHETWCGLKMKYQIQIPYFNNITWTTFNCISCNEKIGRQETKLRIHMDSESHRSSVDFGDITGFLLDNRQGCPAFTKESLEAILASLDENLPPIQNSQLDGSYNTDSDSDVAEAEGIQIDCYFHTTRHFYPDFDKHYIIVESERLPIFRETICGLVCMICRMNPRVSSIEEHLNNNVHMHSMTDERLRKKVKIFHVNWAIQSTDVQLHQRFIRGTKCLPCTAEVSYEEIDRHVLSSKHQRKSTLPPRLYVEKAIVEEDALEDQAIVSQAGRKTQKGSPPIGKNNKNGKNAAATPKAGSSRKLFHEIRQSILDPVSSNIEDRIPTRYFQQANYFTIDSENNAICELCSTKVKGDVISHLYNSKHAEGTYLIPKKMKYFCGICYIQIDTETYWRSHMTDLKHIARCNGHGQSKQGQVVAEYECLTCNLVLYGDDFSVRKHIFGKKKVKELVLPKSVLYLFANRDYINTNLEKLLEEANKAWKNQDKERQVCLALVRVLKEIFPQCKAYPFGSRVTGLGYCDSDLDVFLDTGDMFSGGHHQSANDQALIVNLVAGALKKHKNSFSNINKVAGARTPIVQVLHEDTGIDCDISFKHGLSVENTAFISLCLDMQPILRPAMLYLKEWCIATNISSLSSYALTMLVIFYLQRNGYLPSLKDLRVLNPSQSNVIAGWETIKYTAPLLTMKEQITNCDYNIIEFMENFFEYYANFEFEKFVVCPLMGSTLDKALFNDLGQDLPKEMESYVLQLYPNRNREFFRNLTPMCVQDPFDLSHNLTKACSKDMVNKFKGYCNLSLKYLRALE